MSKAMTDKLAEEILKTSCAENKVFLTSNEWHTIIEAMQTFHEAKMRDELFAFNKWMCHKQYDGEIPLISKCIDEYLNQ